MASSKRSTKDGVSLAKGPVALLGAVMLAYGIIAFLLGGNGFSASPTSGDVDGDTFLGIEGNGWTNLLWAASGALLLFGSPFHRGAKTTAMTVGLVLGAASVIAMLDGFATGDVLGIFATDSSTILALGASSAYLLLTAFLPKVGKGRKHDHDAHARHEHAEPVREPRSTEREAIAHDGPGAHHRETEHHDAADRDAVNAREPDGRFDRTSEREVTRPAPGLSEDPQVRAARDAERER